MQLTVLSRSKTSNEFLVLHYFDLDSAKLWDALLTEVLPAVRLPGESARWVFELAHRTVSSQNGPCFVD